MTTFKAPNYVQLTIEALHSGLRSVGKDPAKSLPDRLVPVYVLLIQTTGVATTERDVHNAWAAARVSTEPDHPDIVPFERLSPEQVARDTPHVRAIREAARLLMVWSS